MKRVLLALILLMSSAAHALTLTAGESAEEWTKRYQIKSFTQDHIAGLATFICNLLSGTCSEENFTAELERLNAQFPDVPRDFTLAALKLFERAYLAEYRQKKADAEHRDDSVWKQELLEYYEDLYDILSEGHRKIAYGQREGRHLPTPDILRYNRNHLAEFFEAQRANSQPRFKRGIVLSLRISA